MKFNFNTRRLPKYDAASEHTSEELFEKSARDGLDKRLERIAKRHPEVDQKKYRDQIDHEISVIKSSGFSDNCLIVADYVRYARENNIRVGHGRGSAAGSLALYSLGITDVDPIEHRLVFERFLNPERIRMPDIDIDFCMNGKGDVIKYVEEKYGSERVARIITFGTLNTKVAICEVGRAIEGLPLPASNHATGIIISDKPLVEYFPLCRSGKGNITTRLDLRSVEKLGLVKFDFLGLKELTLITNTLALISRQGDKAPDLSEIDLNDPDTFRMLSAGDTKGVFQFESSGMKDLIVRLKPNCFDDLIALYTLDRPGLEFLVLSYIAGKQGRKKIVCEVPQLENILKRTYGMILYQEQLMRIAATIASYTMAKADNLRRSIGARKLSEMKKEEAKFMAGAAKNGLTERNAKQIWDNLSEMGRYVFNKSHSVAYGMIAFQTAYLKAHYPVQFMKALDNIDG